MFAIALLVVCEAQRDQSVAVKGQFLCGSAPAANVRVKLINRSISHDLLGRGNTDASGNFMLSGGTAKLTQIDPVLKVSHDCNNVRQLRAPLAPGIRRETFVIPKKYITKGKIPKKIMDIGTINLELRFQNERRKLKVNRIVATA
ncbi:Transthyretin-like family protein [Ancylostoma duodenale]|uniref:Transthyretin-like family protein n=1 Tax=Ancylostoma duodenale TaxID=51022 RepID=A0A0C2GGD5_9BILA|nr:Transthyretin-like family protein [Ancylostoma duodenale]